AAAVIGALQPQGFGWPQSRSQPLCRSGHDSAAGTTRCAPPPVIETRTRPPGWSGGSQRLTIHLPSADQLLFLAFFNSRTALEPSGSATYRSQPAGMLRMNDRRVPSGDSAGAAAVARRAVIRAATSVATFTRQIPLSVPK